MGGSEGGFSMLHPEPAQKAWNPDAIRSDFPLIAGLSGYGRITYLDNAASAQKPRSVMDSMTDGAFTRYANVHRGAHRLRSEEHTSELQSLMRISYAVFCLNRKKINKINTM